MKEKKKLSKKAKAAKVFLWVSFAPYAIILIAGLWDAVFGVSAFTIFPDGGVRTIYYGWEAFSQTVALLVYAFSSIFPVLPICLIYQITYIIYKIYKRKNS
jgi:hypothetical protein